MNNVCCNNLFSGCIMKAPKKRKRVLVIFKLKAFLGVITLALLLYLGYYAVQTWWGLIAGLVVWLLVFIFLELTKGEPDYGTAWYACRFRSAELKKEELENRKNQQKDK